MRWAIVAHPDDEIIFAGGAILAHREEPWTVVIATHAEGSPRAAEAIAARDALRGMGVEIDYRFLGHDDVQFHAAGGIDAAALVRQLSGLGVRPGERVYTHGAPGEYGHGGHRAVHAGVDQALGPLAEVSVFSGGGGVMERFDDPDLLARKARLFDAAYPSQAGVWRGLASLMREVMREERHMGLAPTGETLSPDEVIARAVSVQLGLLPEIGDALIVGPAPAEMLDAIRAKAPDLPQQGDELADDGPDDPRFDLIVGIDLLSRTPHLSPVLETASRRLRPRGQLILVNEPLVEGHPDLGQAVAAGDVPRYRWPTQTILDQSRRNGLKLRQVVDFVAGADGGLPRLRQLFRFERR